MDNCLIKSVYISLECFGVVRFALSDSKCSDYLEACNDIHDGACDRCRLTERSIHEINDALSLVAATSEELDGLRLNTEQARRNINVWKARLLRAVSQDETRINVTLRLDEY